METTQARTSPRTSYTNLSPLKQHPISSDPLPSPDATRTIFLDHPSARWSSSPASSPRIADPSPVRRGSVYPALSDTMQKEVQRGLEPGIDFFDDETSGSEWEPEADVTQILPEGEGIGLRRLSGTTTHTDYSSRGRSRWRSGMTTLPPFKLPPASRSGLDIRADGKSLSSPVDADGGKRARPVSLKRLSKDNVRVVQTRSRGNTPRNSLKSTDSIRSSAPIDVSQDAASTHVGLTRLEGFQGRHRRNTSESILAGSIIDAHVMTMRALESLNLLPSSILVDSNSQQFTKRPSFTEDRRHIKLSPLTSTDRERPLHLPAHFVRTPYPFSAKKEFPKPKSRPRGDAGLESPYSGDLDGFIRLDSGYGEEFESKEVDDTKGKHVLVLMTSEGDYDLRSRLERNEDAQGIIRSRVGSGLGGTESAIWLSLERRSWRKAHHVHQGRNLVKITIPTNLATSSDPEQKKGSDEPIDCDDNFLAERLRVGHRSLAGNWFRRTFSARKLRHISLGQVSTWSGRPSQSSAYASPGLLAVGAGIDMEADLRSPFTKEGIMKLYRTPSSGKARYTWVHWARRVDTTRSSDVPDSLTSVQFVHTLSVSRILSALTLMLVLSIAAALLWVFFGPGGTGWRTTVDRQRSDRVGSGMAVGIMVLLCEGLGFGTWIWFS